MAKQSGTRWRGWIAGTLMVSLAISLTGCGTLLYPERRGQGMGRLDLGVVALDGIGLLLFFVPGVIAFVVDFATGAIFLPPEYGQAGPDAETELRKVQLDPAELTPRRVEALVLAHTGQTVNLQAGEYRAMKLQKLDEFTPEALAELQADPHPARVHFRANDE